MNDDLKTAFNKDTLRHCWTWLNSDSNNDYKSYFRSLYKAYSLALEENINKLHLDLKNHRYKTEFATKLYIPKKSGILRPFTLLNLNDQIVYLALIFVIAEKLNKKAKKNYHKSVFGHLYAGKSSSFFYENWRDGYVKYTHAINDAYKSGFKWIASFDLTAFYDSIDHKVLTHFLIELGITKEFAKYLIDCLETWTASTPNRIYHGHGIPQGPLPSGLLSEVILQHFDEHKSFKKSSVKYFRYVDDIRLLGKTEDDVRKALLELDYISKEVGLFPQSSKINIHEITDIDEEIKTVSLPPEPIDFKLTFNQKEVQDRLVELSKGNKIEDETRFKFVLAYADPEEKLAKRLLTILRKNPHLYQSILKHFSKYKKFSRPISKTLLEQIGVQELYEEVTASYLICCLNKIHKDIKPDFKKYCEILHKKRKGINSPNLRSIVFVWLLNENHIKFREIESIYKRKEWWLIHNSLEYIDIDLFGKPSYEAILNALLKSDSFEVSIKAAFLLVENNLEVKTPLKEINDAAQIILRKANLIGKTVQKKNSINQRLEEICETKFPNMSWNTFLNSELRNCERLCCLLTSYIKTDANAFINELDVFNDLILNALFKHDTSIGAYNLGKIGSCLTLGSRFANKYPKLFKLCETVHRYRLESDLSHPKVKSTGKPTRRIKFYEIRKLKPLIVAGYKELISLV